MKLFKRFSKEERKRRQDEREVREFNERQEKYDEALKEAAQKSRFKTLLSRLKFETYTKRLVAVIIFVCLIDLQLSYVLAFMDKMQIAESLSSQICITILGTAFIYMLKAYFETKAEKSSKEYENKMRKTIENDIYAHVQSVLGNTGINLPSIYDLGSGNSEEPMSPPTIDSDEASG